METPVTYFYTDKLREVNVKVGFPKGLLTEFYPPVRKMLPEFDPKAAFNEGEPLGNSLLDWGTVTLIPPSALAPNLADGDLQNRLAHHLAADNLCTTRVTNRTTHTESPSLVCIGSSGKAAMRLQRRNRAAVHFQSARCNSESYLFTLCEFLTRVI